MNKILTKKDHIIYTYALSHAPSLYPSPYLVFTNRGYTKHYYSGTERLAARIGGGFDRPVVGGDHGLSQLATALFEQCQKETEKRVLEAIPPHTIRRDHLSENIYMAMMREFETPMHLMANAVIKSNNLLSTAQNIVSGNAEPDVYFYHSDHLGSASWITDGDGKPVQHLQYLPYGEPFVNQRAAGSTYSERFRFTGKERDEETGYGYFGARYMDHELMTMWLSVDPLSDKYPSISPYAYCAWNPIRLIDPDGREAIDDWVKRSDGTIYWDPTAKGPSSTKQGEDYLGKKGSTYDSRTNEVTLYRQNGTMSKFQSNGPMTDGNYTYPIDVESDTYNNYSTNPSALYGASRGNRKHAGCDLYAPEGTAVFSITQGTVLSVGGFYKGTDEIAIDHDFFIGRYCELIPSFEINPGCKVNSGDFLGVVVSMDIKNGGNNSMLHFEMYRGNAHGALTDKTDQTFKRRSDLKNPTPFLNNVLARTWSL